MICERLVELLPRLLDVRFDEVDDAMHQRVREPRLDRRLAPCEIRLALLARPFHRLGELHQAFGRIRTPVEDDVLDVFEQILGMSS